MKLLSSSPAPDAGRLHRPPCAAAATTERGRRDRRRRGRPPRAAPPPHAHPNHRPQPAGRPPTGSAVPSWRSPHARPASPTPTWPPTRSSPPARAGVDARSRRRGRPASTPLAAGTIDDADAVIFATDVGVKDGRFAGKPVVASGVKRAIDEPDTMIGEAVAAADDPSAARVHGQRRQRRRRRHPPACRLGHPHASDAAHRVSYMIPFVAAGGLLIALGFLLGGYEISGPPEVPNVGLIVDELAGQLPDGGPTRRTWVRCCSSRCSWRSASSSPRCPATSPSRSPTGPVLAPGFTAGRGGLRRRRLHRRPRRRPDRGFRRPVDQPAQGAPVVARPDARRGHPAFAS